MYSEYDYILTSDGELYHYGVKGMKWGVRRAETRLRSTAKANKLERKLSDKKRAEQFRADVKAYKKKGIEADYEFDVRTGELKVTQFYDSRGRKIGHDYAQKIMRKGNSEKAISSLVGTAAVMVGLSVVGGILNSR